ncbi:sulfatase-like hydrolase/transferase [Desulfobaculum senezii]
MTPLKRFGLGYAAFASFSLFIGLFLFFSTFRIFFLADTARSLLIDMLFAAPLLILGRFGIVYLLLALGFLGVSCVLNILHIATYTSVLSPFAIQAIIETTPKEASELLVEQFSFFKLALCLACWVVPILCLNAYRKLRPAPITKMGQALIAFFLIASGVIGFKAYDEGFKLLSSHHGYMSVWSVNRYFNELRSIKLASEDFDPASLGELSIQNAPDTLVIIVGESANRNHMGIYGYHRQTTPKLAALQNEITVFDDVISPATHTIPSLKQCLRFPAKDLEDSYSIIDVLNAAGYKTYWFSNQPVIKSMTNVLETMNSHCKVRKYVNLSRNAGKTCTYDEAMLPLLDKALQDSAPKKAIFLHQIGSHLSYSLRYPHSFNHFTTVDDIPSQPWFDDKHKKNINEYDNSIYYTDWFVSEVINTMKNGGPKKSAVLYFSDHGQDVYDSRDIRGCSEAYPSRHMVEIPFVTWLSPQYAANAPSLAQRIKARKLTPYSTRTLSITIAQLAGISFTKMQHSAGLFAPEYAIPKVRMTSHKDYSTLREAS